MKPLPRLALLLAPALAQLLASPASAQLYRTRDAKGRLVITNRKPSSGARPLAGGTLSIASLPGTTDALGGATGLQLIERRDALSSISSARRAPYVQHVADASAKYMLSPRLLNAVIAVESGFNPKARSSKGAQGLMQLMPDTARDLAVEDPYDPAANIHGGAHYLRQMLDLFGGDLTMALAAYNAGPNAVSKAGGVPMISETADYVRKVKSLLYGGMLVFGTSSLHATRAPGGRIRMTNFEATQSSTRLLRDPRGTLLITNR